MEPDGAVPYVLEHRTGDLFSATGLDGLAHGCNCAGAMGRGIAVEFRRRWPAMYAEYRMRCLRGTFVLGDVLPWETDGLTVYNLAIKQHWRSRADLGAIGVAVGRMVEHARARQVGRIGLPMIGAGLGGLGWGEVERVITEAAAGSGVRLVVFSLPEPAPGGGGSGPRAGGGRR